MSSSGRAINVIGRGSLISCEHAMYIATHYIGVGIKEGGGRGKGRGKGRGRGGGGGGEAACAGGTPPFLHLYALTVEV